MQRYVCTLLLVLSASLSACGEVKAPSTPDASNSQMVTVTVTRAGDGSGVVTSSPGGINCGATCTMQVAPGTAIILTAAADGTSTFTGWSGGGCSGTSTCGVTVSADTTITATFAKQQFTLTVAPSGNGTGLVTSSPAGINCGSMCSMKVNPGTQITLTAAPNSGTTFVGWTGGGCTGTATTCTVTVSADTTVQPAFALNNSLVVTLGGTGTGTVTSSPSGISCPSGCSAQYSPGQMVTLTAAAGVQSTFSGWGGACSGTGTTCTVTINAATGVTANFALNQYTLTVKTNGGTGTGTVTSNPSGINCGTMCSAPFGYNTQVTLTASPNANSTFSGWSGGNCSGTGQCVVTVTAATTVTANFSVNQATLTVATGGTGTGTVTSSPAGITCPGTCSAGFPVGQSVTLTESATGGSTFAGWSGACSGTATTCTVTMNTAQSVTANFTAGTGTPPILYWTFDGNGNNTGSAAGYNLTLNGSISFVTGKFGQAAQYNAGSYATMVGSARAILGVSPQYTISFWVNVSSTVNTGNSAFDFWNRNGTGPYGGIQFSFGSTSSFVVCVANTTKTYLPTTLGGCNTFTAGGPGAWHNVIMRYAGTGTGAGQGANVDVYVDDVLVKTIVNDAGPDPVFNSSIADTLYVGTSGVTWDDVRVYNTTFTTAQQCTQVIGGTWNGSTCTLP